MVAPTVTASNATSMRDRRRAIDAVIMRKYIVERFMAPYLP